MLGLTKAWYGDYSGNVVPFSSGGGAGIDLPSDFTLDESNDYRYETDTFLLTCKQEQVYYENYSHILIFQGGYRLAWFFFIDCKNVTAFICGHSSLRARPLEIPYSNTANAGSDSSHVWIFSTYCEFGMHNSTGYGPGTILAIK